MKIFISYSHEDWFAANVIELWLEKAGHISLRDEKAFARGSEIPKEILSNIKKSEIVLALLSEKFFRSDYTQMELGEAKASRKQILFISIDGTLPKGAFDKDIPLNMTKVPVASWRREIQKWVQTLSRKSGTVLNLDQFFSRTIGSNDWVAERAQRENIAFSHLTLSSTIELASKPEGWKEDQIKIVEIQGSTLEPEVITFLKKSGLERVSESQKDNLKLLSLREDLTDEPYLSLEVQKESHDLARIVADNFEQVDEMHTPKYHFYEKGSIPYPHSIVVHLVLVTKDEHFIIGHRSDRPRFYENCWAVSYEEHLRPSLDDVSLFSATIRGLKEELIGNAKTRVSKDDITFFSLFRELDKWTNDERQETFWDINVGLAGLIRIDLALDEVFDNWLATAVDKREFRHLVGLPYEFDILYDLAINKKREFNPLDFSSILRVPRGTDPSFPEFFGKPKWNRWHPTSRIRLVRCLTYDFLKEVQDKISHLSSRKMA